MPWIKQINKREWRNWKIEVSVEKFKNAREKFLNIMKINSLDAINPWKPFGFVFINYTQQNQTLTLIERKKLIAIIVALNNCSYCIHHHAEALNHYWKDDAKINALISDHNQSDFPIRTSNFNYAEKLTLTRRQW